MKKWVKARKLHKCDECGAYIEAGQPYMLYKGRLPVYDDGDSQIGIEFYQARSCQACEGARAKEVAEIEAYMQTDEYQHWAASQEHRYP